MRVNPPDSAAVDLVMPDELDHFRVCDQGRLAHHSELGKKLCARTAVTDHQLPVNEIVTEHFIAGEKPVEAARVRFGSSQETDPNRCINKDHSCTAALARSSVSTPRYVARARLGSAQSAKTLVGSMPDKRLESQPYGLGICCGTAHGACLLEKLFVNVERLLHTDDLAISFHPEQPDSPTECRPLHASAIITIDETTWRLRIADSGQVGPVALTASTNENPKFLPA